MTPAERNAIGFFALLAAAGAGARALGVGDPPGLRPPTAADRLALQHQLAVVDSAHAQRERGRAGARADGRPRRRMRTTERPPDRTPDRAPAADLARAGRSAPARAVELRVPLDVNAADSAALETLPGVGPSLARRIVADRAARGSYASIAELSRVPGIGPALERQLARAVTFTPGGRPSSGSAPAPEGAHRGVPAGGRAGWPAP